MNESLHGGGRHVGSAVARFPVRVDGKGDGGRDIARRADGLLAGQNVAVRLAKDGRDGGAAPLDRLKAEMLEQDCAERVSGARDH